MQRTNPFDLVLIATHVGDRTTPHPRAPQIGPNARRIEVDPNRLVVRHDAASAKLRIFEVRETTGHGDLANLVGVTVAIEGGGVVFSGWTTDAHTGADTWTTVAITSRGSDLDAMARA